MQFKFIILYPTFTPNEHLVSTNYYRPFFTCDWSILLNHLQFVYIKSATRNAIQVCLLIIKSATSLTIKIWSYLLQNEITLKSLPMMIP